MRALAVVLSFVAFTSFAQARTHKKKKRVAHAGHAQDFRNEGQSIGAPWDGRLQDATQLPPGDGYFIRRPWRSFGTRTTVELIERVLDEFRDQFPDAHVLAIGDLSAEHGGPITEHHSHQTGRDADIGLVYDAQPAGYPATFVTANRDNLDPAATLAIIEAFAATAHKDGGVQVMFLDYDVQGILWRWAWANGVDEDTLARLFQYPSREVTGALVRHEPNHANHLHVRFKCAREDADCR